MIKSKTMRWVGYVAHTRRKINAYNVLVGKTAGKTQVDIEGVDGCKDNIKKCLK
jgi:hypothetical protein